jgi:hypothetical protein
MPPVDSHGTEASATAVRRAQLELAGTRIVAVAVSEGNSFQDPVDHVYLSARGSGRQGGRGGTKRLQKPRARSFRLLATSSILIFRGGARGAGLRQHAWGSTLPPDTLTW